MADAFRDYAPFYDLLYRDKDYPAEAAFVSDLLAKHFRRSPAAISILDLACGTGRHALELARLGHAATGSDLSPDMIALARERAERAGIAIPFHTQSFQTCAAVGGCYDAITMMFSAIDYLTERADLARTLDNVKTLLAPGGVLVFDYWNGNAVLAEYSPVRVRRGVEGERMIQRVSTTTVDALHQIATVQFDFMLFERQVLRREFSETHRMRYYFPQEMQDLLENAGFEVLKRCPFMQPEAALQPRDWNVTVMARPCI